MKKKEKLPQLTQADIDDVRNRQNILQDNEYLKIVNSNLDKTIQMQKETINKKSEEITKIYEKLLRAQEDVDINKDISHNAVNQLNARDQEMSSQIKEMRNKIKNAIMNLDKTIQMVASDHEILNVIKEIRKTIKILCD